MKWRFTQASSSGMNSLSLQHPSSSETESEHWPRNGAVPAGSLAAESFG